MHNLMTQFSLSTGSTLWLFVVASAWTFQDSRPAAGQGFFRRLQERIETRIDEGTSTSTADSDSAATRLLPVTDATDSDDSGIEDAVGTGSLPDSSARFGPSILAQGSITSGKSGTSGRSQQNEKAEDGSDQQQKVVSGPSMGIQVLPSDDDTPGLRVVGIRSGSQAGKAGLREGDLIIAVDGKPTPNVQPIADMLKQRRVGDKLRATVLRDDSVRIVMIPLLDRSKLARLAAKGDTPPGNSGVLRANQTPEDAPGQPHLPLQNSAALAISQVSTWSFPTVSPAPKVGSVRRAWAISGKQSEALLPLM